MRPSRTTVASLACFTLFLGVFFRLLALNYPLVGQDYFYFLPRLLSGAWHFANAGLLPYRYIPHLCGGFPMYGNPQDVYYSVLQFASMIMDPWLASLLVMLIALVAGYAGWVRFGRDVAGLSVPWTHFLSLAALANGYYLLHMVIGHLTFHTTPLLGWFLWFLLRPGKESNKRMFVQACAAGLFGASILYAGGYFVLMQGGLLYAMLLPFVLLQDGNLRERAQTLAARLLWNGSAMVLTGISKLTAVYAFMRFFPRLFPFTRFETPENILLFIGKMFWLIPQQRLAFDDVVYPAGFHEYSMFFSPILFLGVLAMLIFFAADVRRRRSASGWARGAILAVYSVLLLVIFAQMARGYGPVADVIQRLPLFSSWRMNMRFLFLLGLLLTIGGTISLERALRALRWDRFAGVLAPAASLITVVLFYVAYAGAISPAFLDVTTPYEIIRALVARSGDFTSKPVAVVQDLRNQKQSDFQYILAGTTGMSCYETILSQQILPQLTAGPTAAIIDGAFNLNQPACLQYPEANGCKPGDRIPATDRDNFLLYVTGKQPRWRLPWWQRLADVVTLGSLAVSVVVLVRAVCRRKVKI